MVPIERPDEFNHLVTRFLSACEPADVSATRLVPAVIGAHQ